MGAGPDGRTLATLPRENGETGSGAAAAAAASAGGGRGEAVMGSALAKVPEVSQEQRLRERLRRLGLDMVVVSGDGNCQVSKVNTSSSAGGIEVWRSVVNSVLLAL